MPSAPADAYATPTATLAQCGLDPGCILHAYVLGGGELDGRAGTHVDDAPPRKTPRRGTRSDGGLISPAAGHGSRVEPGSAATPTPTTWPCPACTFDNALAAPECAMCHTAVPAEVVATLAASSDHDGRRGKGGRSGKGKKARAARAAALFAPATPAVTPGAGAGAAAGAAAAPARGALEARESSRYWSWCDTGAVVQTQPASQFRSVDRRDGMYREVVRTLGVLETEAMHELRAAAVEPSVVGATKVGGVFGDGQ